MPSTPRSTPAGIAPRPAPGALARGAGLVTPALMLVNAAGYVLAVAASRALDPDGYGRLTALLAVLLVVSVPALSVQAVVARTVARGVAPQGVDAALAMLRWAVLVGLAVAGAAAALAPLVAAFLRVQVSGPLWVAAGLLPLVVLSATMGLLQGAERFGALALVLCAQALGKVLGLVPLALDGGPAAVLAALAVGTAVSAALALLLLRTTWPTTSTRRGARRGHRPHVRELGAAALALVAVLGLANVDLLMARHLLTGELSGRYAVGAVCAKIAFWLPQAVAVVVFPRLTDPERGRLVLVRAVQLVTALSAVGAAAAVVLGRPLVALTFGGEYADVAPLVPLFVVLGGLLAVVQLLVYRAIATDERRSPALVLAAVPVMVLALLALRPTTPGGVVALALTVVVVLVTGLLTLTRRPENKITV